MKFTYTYKTSDNVRHEAEISASCRDEVFASLREKGIRPIRVTVADGEVEQNDVNDERSGRRKIVFYALFAAFVLLVTGLILHSRSPLLHSSKVMTPQGPVVYTVALPLPRQTIPGDRSRIEAATGGKDVFQFAAEAYLARFAEPGRPLETKGEGNTPSNFMTCLKTPIRIASTDFTEVVDLKRIVAGMKLEMRAYLAGGGTTEQYLAELEKRQRLEISYRENAERRLNEILNGGRGMGNEEREARNQRLQAAYLYWLKANAQLQSMGIYPLPLIPALRAYQQTQPLGEEMP